MEQYDDETLKQLDSWFLEQKEKGFTIEQIKQSMIENGYDAKFSEQFVAKKTGVEPTTVDVSNNQINDDDNSSQTAKTTTTESKTNEWQTKTSETTTETLSEAQKQENFKNYSYFNKVKLIITKPKQFFDEMPQEGGYKEPLLFATINYFLIIMLTIGFGFLTYKEQITEFINAFETSMINTYAIISGLIIVGWILYIIFNIIISGTITQIFFKLFKGKGSRQATIRVISYLSAIGILATVPVIGSIIGLYAVYVALIGYSKIHEVSIAKAIGVLIVQIIVILIIFIIIMVIIAYIAYDWIQNSMNAFMNVPSYP
ncbi:hypothetical protein GQ473_00115 [archaeon]|nr:hypothetical protein [archaeon]